MIRKFFSLSVLVIALLLFSSPVSAQWPTDSDTNMVICDHSGEQAIPLIAATSDGGCYICWYDHQSGNYDLYLQRLNADGEIQWAENGMLISDHPQDSWLTDYSMTVDQNDNAIIVFNDQRNGDDWDIYAYKISPDGAFLWGDDGLTISDNDTFEPTPQVTMTSNGNIVIAWQNENIIHLRKLSPDGNDYWSEPNVITLTSDYGLSVPRLAAGEDDAVLLQILVQQGPNYWDPKHIYMHKFTDYGDPSWGGNGICVSNAGAIGPQIIPGIVSDGNGGAYSFWYDTRISNQHHTYVQHINSAGVPIWQLNGVQVSLSTSQYQMNPALVAFPETGNVMVFYKTSNFGQTEFGIGGQLLSAESDRRWGNDGIELMTLANRSSSAVEAVALGDDAIVTCFRSPVGDVLNYFVYALKITVDGDPGGWSEPQMISSHLSEKLHKTTAITTNDQIVSVWEDRRPGAADIYLQNINPDASLGPWQVSVEPAGSRPLKVALHEAYPNPFNASTTISYSLESAGNVTLEIYDLLGRKVTTLVDEFQAAGEHSLTWYADDIVSGVYFVRLNTAGMQLTDKLVLLK